MLDFNLTIIISSFIAGVLTFFAPCTLPLVPAFLGIISGARIEELKNPEIVKIIRWQIFKNAVFYVLGFSIIFILFGVAFAYVGTLLIIRELIGKVGGLIIITFGLVLLGWLKLPWLDFEKKIKVSYLFQHASSVNSFLLGVIFALGWSPCVGPLLGSILFLASTSGTVIQGTLLLVIFSIGLSAPFLITALFIGKAFSAFSKWENFLLIINRIAGASLIFIGALLLIGQFQTFHSWLTLYFYRFYFFEVFVNRFL